MSCKRLYVSNSDKVEWLWQLGGSVEAGQPVIDISLPPLSLSLDRRPPDVVSIFAHLDLNKYCVFGDLEC